MARPSLQAVGQNALASFQRMTGPQRVTLGLAFTATAIGVLLLARATGSVPMSTLYADLDPDVAAVASQANVGGGTSALALARSLGRADLVLPALLMGALGNGLGTYLGFVAAELLG